MKHLTLVAFVCVAACSDRPPRERPRADVPAVQVVASPEAMPLVEVVAKEPNDDAARATRLAVGERATDTIAVAGDVDVFAVTLARPMALRVALDSPEDADLVLELVDATGAVLAASDRGPAGVVEGLPNLSLPSGAYTLTVREFVKKAAKPPKAKPAAKGGAKATAAAAPVADPNARTSPSQPYTLAVTELVVALEDEREPNDSIATAGLLALAEVRKGFIGWRGDSDVWQLGMEGLGEQNVLDIQVQAVAAPYPVVEVLTAAGDVLATRKAGQAGLLVVRGLVAPPDGAWVRISGTPSNHEQGYELQFAARYEATPDPTAPAAQAPSEREPNDTAAQATSLVVPLMTAWLDLGDADVFAVPAAPSTRSFVAIGGEGLDLVLEEVAGTRVVQTINAAALGGSEQLVLAPAATTVRVRAHKRRGAITLGGEEARYEVQLIDLAQAANQAAAQDPAVDISAQGPQ